MRYFTIGGCFATLVLLGLSDTALAKDKVLRTGIIGCDTSHVTAFTDLLNDPAATGAMAEVQVTVAYPGGSPDIPASADRLNGYVEQLRKKNVKIVDSLEALAAESDVVLLESVDGRPHLEQFRAVAQGKPVFIDKPFAASLADVIAIFRLAEKTKTPVFTSSAIRYFNEVQAVAADKSIGELLGCETTGPMHLEKHHPDLFWYGIHGVEGLYTIMGTGCQTVSRTDGPGSSLVVGKWKDGKIGAFRGLKEGNGYYAVTAYGTKTVAHKIGQSGYENLMREVCDFLVSGKPPVAKEVTLELYAFMAAADESKKQGGKPVSIADVMKKAEQEADGK